MEIQSGVTEELRRANSRAWRRDSEGVQRANEEEGVGIKRDKVGGRGNAALSRNQEGRG